MKTRNLLTAFVSAIMLTISCNKEDNTYTPDVSTDDLTASAKLDIAIEDVAATVADDFEEEIAMPYTSVRATAVTTCPTKTRTLNTPTLTPGTVVTKVIDFGNDGCLVKGNLLKGKIKMVFTFQPKATSHVITYTLDNFYHNGIKMEGTKLITLTKEATVANQNIHWVVKIELNITSTHENGKIIKTTGSKVREIIAGDDTPLNPSDNVYQITGSWESVFSSGATRTATITTPLIVKTSCTNPEIVKGIINFEKNGKKSSLNFGNGDCDNKALLTINGLEVNIFLKK